MEAGEKGEFLTGLLFVDPRKPDLTRLLNLPDEPLAQMGPERVRPGRSVLEEIMKSMQ